NNGPSIFFNTLCYTTKCIARVLTGSYFEVRLPYSSDSQSA
ncbi:uncharacterized protein METZ01_LOCUS392738, partial [marine metagenome]